MTPWAALAWLWLLLSSITLLTGVGMVAVSWSLGARPVRVRFHVGPALLSFRLFGVRWSFGPLSFGTSASFTPEGVPEDTADNPYLKLPLPRRLLAISSSVLSMLLIAGLCLSPGRGLAAFLSGFEQVVNVPLAPERVQAFFALLRAEGFWTALGVSAAKLAAFNLLPLFPLAGYQLLREVWMKLRRGPPAPASALVLLALLPTLVLSAGWLYGLYGGLRDLGAQAAPAQLPTSNRAAP